MHRQIVDTFYGIPRDLAWRAKPGVNPDAVFILILECGHSYAFHDLEAFGLDDYVSRFGRELDCVQCDSFLTRTSKRPAGHHLSGRYAGYYDLVERQRLLAQQKQISATSPRDMETDRDGESDHERPTKATIEEIARAVALAIQENTNRLINDLLGRGEMRNQQPFANPDRPTTLAFGIECLLFSAFPLDVIVAAEFGSHSDRIRSSLADCLFELAQNMGLSREHADSFDRLRDTRFEEYGDVLKRGYRSHASFEELARVAWTRISGGEPQTSSSHVILFTALMATLKSFNGIAAWYTVVG